MPFWFSGPTGDMVFQNRFGGVYRDALEAFEKEIKDWF